MGVVGDEEESSDFVPAFLWPEPEEEKEEEESELKPEPLPEPEPLEEEESVFEEEADENDNLLFESQDDEDDFRDAYPGPIVIGPTISPGRTIYTEEDWKDIKATH